MCIVLHNNHTFFPTSNVLCLVDSPGTENQISSSPPDRRRRPRGKRRYQNERRNNPPNDRQTDDTSEDAEEWPLPNAQPTTNT